MEGLHFWDPIFGISNRSRTNINTDVLQDDDSYFKGLVSVIKGYGPHLIAIVESRILGRNIYYWTGTHWRDITTPYFLYFPEYVTADKLRFDSTGQLYAALKMRPKLSSQEYEQEGYGIWKWDHHQWTRVGNFHEVLSIRIRQDQVFCLVNDENYRSSIIKLDGGSFRVVCDLSDLSNGVANFEVLAGDLFAVCGYFEWVPDKKEEDHWHSVIEVRKGKISAISGQTRMTDKPKKMVSSGYYKLLVEADYFRKLEIDPETKEEADVAVSSPGLTMWKGNEWTSTAGGLKKGTGDPKIEELDINTHGGKIEILVTGNFDQVDDSQPANGFAIWKEGDWQAPHVSEIRRGAKTFLPALKSAAIWNDQPVIAGSLSGGKPNWFAAIQQGSEWQALENPAQGVHLSLGIKPFGPLHGIIFSMAPAKDGGVYIVGAFDVAGDVPVKGIAHWNGTRWSSVGRGIENHSSWFTINKARLRGVATRVISDKEELIVVGEHLGESDGKGGFDQFGRICIWRGDQWTSLDPGAQLKGEFTCVATDLSGNIYVGGGRLHFASPDKPYDPVRGLVIWNGKTWSKLGHIPTDDFVRAEVIKTRGQEVFIGGAFAGDNGLFQNVACWDGRNWNSLGHGVNGEVLDLSPDEKGGVHVVGHFTHAIQATGKAISAPGYAFWDGNTWSSFTPEDLSGLKFFRAEKYFEAVLEVGGKVFLVGNVGEVRGKPCGRLIMLENGVHPWSKGIWDNYTNSARAVHTMVAAKEGIFLGGNFSRVDGVFSQNIALWKSAFSLATDELLLECDEAFFPNIKHLSITYHIKVAGYSHAKLEIFLAGNPEMPVFSTTRLTIGQRTVFKEEKYDNQFKEKMSIQPEGWMGFIPNEHRAGLIIGPDSSPLTVRLSVGENLDFMEGLYIERKVRVPPYLYFDKQVTNPMRYWFKEQLWKASCYRNVEWLPNHEHGGYFLKIDPEHPENRVQKDTGSYLLREYLQYLLNNQNIRVSAYMDADSTDTDSEYRLIRGPLMLYVDLPRNYMDLLLLIVHETWHIVDGANVGGPLGDPQGLAYIYGAADDRPVLDTYELVGKSVTKFYFKHTTPVEFTNIVRKDLARKLRFNYTGTNNCYGSYKTDEGFKLEFFIGNEPYQPNLKSRYTPENLKKELVTRADGCLTEAVILERLIPKYRAVVKAGKIEQKPTTLYDRVRVYKNILNILQEKYLRDGFQWDDYLMIDTKDILDKGH